MAAAAARSAQSRFDGGEFQGYRWMDNSVESRREGEAARCAKLYTEIVANANKLYRSMHPEEEEESDLEIGVFGTQYSQAVLMVGRVCCEADENLQPVPDPLNLNPQSLLLEPIFTGGPGASGRGKRLILNVQALDSYTLFPGCVVGVIGRTSPNSCGGELVAEGMVTGAGLEWGRKATNEEPSISLEVAHADSAPIHVVCASGPFQSVKGKVHGGQRLELIAKYVSDFKPGVLILMGPFMDADFMEATLLEEVETPMSFEDKFNKEILPRLVKLALTCRETRTHLILLPSLSECCFTYPLPQPTVMAMKAYEPWATLAKHLEPMRHVRLGGNPCSISINDMMLYVTSTDPLRSFTAEILMKAPEARPKVDLALEQFVSHRSLFPLSPPVVPIDPNKLRAGSLRMPDSTDIVIFPSLLQPFGKEAGGRYFINCGIFTRDTGTGSIASIFISPQKDADRLASRVKIETVKIWAMPYPDSLLPSAQFFLVHSSMLTADVRAVVEEGWERYSRMTPQKVRILDLFIVFLAYLSVIQFVYMWLVGTFPYNSFLSGFWATMGTAALTCCYRIQLTGGRDTFKEVGPERAYADYLVCAGVLFFSCVNFLG
ncbi:DNA polymerase alpha subunit B [Perkinsus olseni]|uniref:DNA polymerase alpha subunit B n=1 Tax=Perkinsus olseni TaxID=32597 RepID=A0A7J6PCN6_PEROL|nr:DNA polymerase alpha subunit B [Perkinsus olseni]